MPTAQMLVRQMKQNNALKAQSMVSGKAAGRSQGIPPSPHTDPHMLSDTLNPKNPYQIQLGDLVQGQPNSH